MIEKKFPLGTTLSQLRASLESPHSPQIALTAKTFFASADKRTLLSHCYYNRDLHKRRVHVESPPDASALSHCCPHGHHRCRRRVGRRSVAFVTHLLALSTPRGRVAYLPSAGGGLSAARYSAINFRGKSVWLVRCYTLLRGCRLPWPPSSCLNTFTLFLVSDMRAFPRLKPCTWSIPLRQFCLPKRAH